MEKYQNKLDISIYILYTYSGVVRGVAGVAEATPIIQFLFNRFGQKIRVKKVLFTAGYTNFKILPTSLINMPSRLTLMLISKM